MELVVMAVFTLLLIPLFILCLAGIWLLGIMIRDWLESEPTGQALIRRFRRLAYGLMNLLL